jgi:hypothetical protein
MSEQKLPNKRAYPAVYEKVIPILFGGLLIAVLTILVVILAVALHIVPGVAY